MALSHVISGVSAAQSPSLGASRLRNWRAGGAHVGHYTRGRRQRHRFHPPRAPAPEPTRPSWRPCC